MLDYRLNLGRVRIQRKPSMINQCFTVILHPILAAAWPNDYFLCVTYNRCYFDKKYIVTLHERILVDQIYKVFKNGPDKICEDSL